MSANPTLEEIHAILLIAHNAIASLYGRLPPDCSLMSAYAIGEARGVLSKAKAMIGRDIDDVAKTLKG